MKTTLIAFASLVAAAGLATAQGTTDNKKAAPPSKAEPAPKKDVAPVPPAAMEMPKPPAEIATVAKAYNGKWKCTGTGSDMAGGQVKLTVAVSSKLDLDKWWIVDTIDVTMGKMKEKTIVYSTYDAKSSKWRRVGVSNGGAQSVGTSDGFKDNKMVYTMDVMGPMGSGQMRESSDLTDPKAAKFWGEMSQDKGKTWMKIYEVTCKK